MKCPRCGGCGVFTYLLDKLRDLSKTYVTTLICFSCEYNFRFYDNELKDYNKVDQLMRDNRLQTGYIDACGNPRAWDIDSMSDYWMGK